MKIRCSLLLLTVALASTSVFAGPSGRSARRAAQLKKRPNSAWLAHYLPDDRYKIAGGVWKFVSTDLDTYYHRPDSPNMMRQPAGRVIGFSSVQEAEEAGYIADPAMNSFGFSGMGGMSGSGMALIGTRMILADGVSSIILPTGWVGAHGPTQRSAEAVATTDQLRGPKGQRLVISTVTVLSGVPANFDMSQIASVQFVKSMQGSMSQFAGRLGAMSQTSGQVNNQFSISKLQGQLNQIQQNIRVAPITLSGVTGVSINRTTLLPGQATRNYMVGRGTKLWTIADFSPGKSSTATVNLLRSLQLR